MLIHVSVDAVINKKQQKKYIYENRCLHCMSLLFLVCMGDVSAAVELHAVRCVTGTIHAVMNRTG